MPTVYVRLWNADDGTVAGVSDAITTVDNVWVYDTIVPLTLADGWHKYWAEMVSADATAVSAIGVIESLSAGTPKVEPIDATAGGGAETASLGGAVETTAVVEPQAGGTDAVAMGWTDGTTVNVTYP